MKKYFVLRKAGSRWFRTWFTDFGRAPIAGTRHNLRPHPAPEAEALSALHKAREMHPKTEYKLSEPA